MNSCIKCGCQEAYPSLPPCPTPAACPNPQPCAEVFDAQCIVFTLPDILCGSDIVVAQDSSVAEALDSIVTYLCQSIKNLTDCCDANTEAIVQINTDLDIINNFINEINIEIFNINTTITTIEGTINTIQIDVAVLQEELSFCCTTKQKFISANYLLTSADNGYSIIITNGATPISITVPTGLSAKLQVGFIQDGTGDVTFVPSGTTLRNAISGYKIKGQYDQAYLEQGATASIYYLLGNTKV